MTKIKELREKKGLSQAALAGKMNVSQQAVARWESGVAMPKSESLPKLADVLDCSIDALYGRDESA